MMNKVFQYIILPSLVIFMFCTPASSQEITQKLYDSLSEREKIDLSELWAYESMKSERHMYDNEEYEKALDQKSNVIKNLMVAKTKVANENEVIGCIDNHLENFDGEKARYLERTKSRIKSGQYNDLRILRAEEGQTIVILPTFGARAFDYLLVPKGVNVIGDSGHVDVCFLDTFAIHQSNSPIYRVD